MKRIFSDKAVLRAGIAGAVLTAGGMLCGCGGGNSADFDGQMQDAVAALADGDYGHAQQLCDGMFAMMCGADSAAVGEAQAVELGIVYMKLSEHSGEDDNVANATQCLRRAMRLSGDSLKAVSASLPLDDERHFVLLRRLGMSIDNPVDLTDRDIANEDFVTDSIEQ